MHTRKAGGVGCTVTNGDMADGWEMLCIRKREKMTSFRDTFEDFSEDFDEREYNHEVHKSNHESNHEADGYHGRHYRIHHARWATDVQKCKASRRGAIVSQLSRHRGRVWGCHGCESYKATRTGACTGDVPEAARRGKGRAQTYAD